MIRTISGTERERGSVSICQVEITYDEDPRKGSSQEVESVSWEASCAACDMHCTNLTEDEAVLELESHVCPDIPPCEREALADA